MLYIIYSELESLIKKVDGSANNTEELGEHIPCEYSMSTIWAFDDIENKHSLFHCKDCMKKFVVP